MNKPIPFAIIGSGWRAEFFFRIAAALPERFQIVGVVVRNSDKAQRVSAKFGLPVFATIPDLLAATKPLFAVTSVPRTVNPAVMTELCHARMPVLSETPPAGTVDEMVRFYSSIGKEARIQVAEQYHLQPLHAARIAFLKTGKIGRPSHAQVSVAHGYHGTSLIRRFLNIGFENCRIRAAQFNSPIVEPRGRDAHPVIERETNDGQTIATLDFGDRHALFDFSFSQYFAYIRRHRVLIRGSRGEIVNEQASYLPDRLTPVHLDFVRHEAGPNGNLEGFHLKGVQVGESWVYHNPLAPAPLSDDEIAIGDCLLKMDHYVRTGNPFYSLAEACQDTYLDLLIQQAVHSDQMVETTTQPWAG